MAVSPYKARYDPLTYSERLARVWEDIDELTLGQRTKFRGNEVDRVRLADLMKQVDWLEAKIAATAGRTHNHVRFRSPSTNSY